VGAGGSAEAVGAGATGPAEPVAIGSAAAGGATAGASVADGCLLHAPARDPRKAAEIRNGIRAEMEGFVIVTSGTHQRRREKRTAVLVGSSFKLAMLESGSSRL
jgi:hypothetical protein